MATDTSCRTFRWPELDAMHYPGFFTAVIDRRSKGEGHTIAIALGWARHPDHLQEIVVAAFDPYQARLARFYQGLRPDVPMSHPMVAEWIAATAREIDRAGPDRATRFRFTAVLQFTP